jgi:glutamine cyclotransferase
VVASLLLGAGCANNKAPPAPATPRVVEDLRVRILRTLPHDRRAFTQGLVYFEKNLYESTGIVGQSSLRRVEPESGRVLHDLALGAPYFGEGLARVGNELVQLTWKNGKAFVFELEGFRPVREHAYEGEGWGLCHDGKRLVMSDGSNKLTFRDSKSFAVTGSVTVTRGGQPVTYLNELECVSGLVYANVWGTDEIARIDPATGEVTGWIEAGGLLSRQEQVGAEVLNGIAYVPERNTFLITGKNWPRLFEVEFVPADSGPAATRQATKRAVVTP